MAFSIICAAFVLWMVYEHLTRYDRAAKALDRHFNTLSRASETKPIPEGFRFHEQYDKWETEGRSFGFRKLGEFYTEEKDGGTASGHATRVLVNPNGDTILAFTRLIVGSRIVENIELENSCSDGTFLYSTNHPLIYHLKSPEKIRVNKVAETELAGLVESHSRFMLTHSNRDFLKYAGIQDVIERTAAQQVMRNEVSKSKEFPIDEEEANQMGINGNSAANKIIYAKLRELRRRRDEAKS